jgi:hypothetical protein
MRNFVFSQVHTGADVFLTLAAVLKYHFMPFASIDDRLHVFYFIQLIPQLFPVKHSLLWQTAVPFPIIIHKINGVTYGRFAI